MSKKERTYMKVLLVANGKEKVVMHTRWTQKGRLAIYNMLKEDGVLPEMDLELTKA